MTTVALLGVPWDASSSFQRGAAAAPAHPPGALVAVQQRVERAWRRSRGDGRARGRGRSRAAGETPRTREPRSSSGSDSCSARAAAARPRRRSLDHLSNPARLRRALERDAPLCRCPRRPLTVLHSTPTLTSTTRSTATASRTPARLLASWRSVSPARLMQVGVRTLNAHQRAQASQVRRRDPRRRSLARRDPAGRPPARRRSMSRSISTCSSRCSRRAVASRAWRPHRPRCARASRRDPRAGRRRRHRRIQPAQRRPRPHRACRRKVREGAGRDHAPLTRRDSGLENAPRRWHRRLAGRRNGD